MTTTNTLFQDYNKFTASIKALKSSVNPHYKNKFAPLDNWLEQVHEHALVHNFMVTEHIRMYHVEVPYSCLVTTLRHISGELFSSEYMLSDGGKPQERGSELTYARRYNIQLILNGAGELDDDAEVAMTTDKVPMTFKRRTA